MCVYKIVSCKNLKHKISNYKYLQILKVNTNLANWHGIILIPTQ